MNPKGQSSATTSVLRDDPGDVHVDEIGFVLHRESNPSWAIRDLVNNKYYIIAYALSGSADYWCAGQSFIVKKGQMVFFPRGVAHTASAGADDPWAFISTAFTVDCRRADSRQLLHAAPMCFTPPYNVPVEALMRELEHAWTGRELGYMLRCRSILMHLVYLLIRADIRPAAVIPHARRLAAVIEFLQRNYTRSHTIDFLSEMANLSPSRFRSLFKQYTGHSANRYQNWLRINKARDMLLTGEYTVTRAAKAVGIEDIYYFSRLFKKMTGMNPSDYRTI